MQMHSDNLEAPTREELAHLEVVQLLEHGAPLAWACGLCGWHRVERARGEWWCERCHAPVLEVIDLAPAWDSTPYVRRERE
jgi:hypothetical protein